ncbi:MAG: hypothetical protein EA426_17115, partial [Spirochaetaceae bacterium]
RLDLADDSIEENRNVMYLTVSPDGVCANDVVLLLHGLNEKWWTKYLPWAHRIATETKRPVVLVPIAFHMDRSPAEWSTPRMMAAVSRRRREHYTGLLESSLANAALSTRLEQHPARLFWSGVQSYNDVVHIVKRIRAGKDHSIRKCDGIDFFGYSIGVLLAQVLLMTDPHGVFADSWLFAFCGGAVMTGMNPVSRYIMDGHAYSALRRYFLEHDTAETKAALPAAMIDTREGRAFTGMLGGELFRAEREAAMRALAPRIHAVAMARDTVVPAAAVRDTLEDATVDTIDPPFAYSHENPFPSREPENAVDAAFDYVMRAAVDHLARG